LSWFLIMFYFAFSLIINIFGKYIPNLALPTAWRKSFKFVIFIFWYPSSCWSFSVFISVIVFAIFRFWCLTSSPTVLPTVKYNNCTISSGIGDNKRSSTFYFCIENSSAIFIRFTLISFLFGVFLQWLESPLCIFSRIRSWSN
jgi:hypothetical protein